MKGHEGLVGSNGDPHGPRTTIPSTPPPLTGSLDPRIRGGNTTRRLLNLLNGPHFRKLHLFWLHVEDLRWMVELVARCSDPLEGLGVMRHPPSVSVLILHWSYSSASVPSRVGITSDRSPEGDKTNRRVFLGRVPEG